MPRPIWRGAISFGLVTIPVQALSATASHDISLRQIHATDGGRIRYRKVCELEDREVGQEEIGRAYPVSGDEVVQLSEEELDSLPIPTVKTFEILAFFADSDIDPLQLDKAYYLSADGPAAAKPYVLLRDAMLRAHKVAVGKVAMRGKEALAVIRVHEGALTLHTMLWPDEIRPHEPVAPTTDIELDEHELELARALMDSMDQVPEAELHDDYTHSLEQIVTAKLEDREPPKAGEPEAPAREAVDLMSALEESVRKNRQPPRGKGRQARESSKAEPKRSRR